MSREAKIGFAAAGVGILVVAWFLYGGGSKSQVPMESAKIAAAAKGTKSQRVRERLAQLRAEREPGAVDRTGSVPKRLPRSAFGDLPDEDPRQRAELLAEEEDEFDFETLRDTALIDEDPDNRVTAIWLLASLEEEEPVLPVLTQALSDEDAEVRMAAIQALSEFSEETPIDSLQLALSDSDAEVRFEALSIAAEMTDERVQPLIAQALDDPDEDVRSLAEGLADLEETYVEQPTPAS